MVSCPKCGKEVPEDANFCPQCGADLQTLVSTGPSGKEEEKESREPQGLLDEAREKRDKYEEKAQNFQQKFQDKIGKDLREGQVALREQISDFETWRNVGYFGGPILAVLLWISGIYLASITKEEPFGMTIRITHPYAELAAFLIFLGLIIFLVGIVVGKYYSKQKDRALDELEDILNYDCIGFSRNVR